MSMSLKNKPQLRLAYHYGKSLKKGGKKMFPQLTVQEAYTPIKTDTTEESEVIGIWKWNLQGAYTLITTAIMKESEYSEHQTLM